MIKFGMGNIFIVLALFSSLSIVIILKLYEKRGFDRYVVIASNYLTAGLMGFFFLGNMKLPVGEVTIFAVIIGLLFFLSFSIFSYSIKKKGIAPAVTFGRLSLAIPVLFSIIFWHESPTLQQSAGIILIFVIIISWEKRISKISPLLLLLFLLFGLIDASMKYFKVRFPYADNNIFLIILFWSALFWGWIFIFTTGRRIRLKEITGGLLLGIPNFFSSYFVLLALSAGVPAFITFPLINTGIIILSAITGNIVFGENISNKRRLLIALGVTAILLLSL